MVRPLPDSFQTVANANGGTSHASATQNGNCPIPNQKEDTEDGRESLSVEATKAEIGDDKVRELGLYTHDNFSHVPLFQDMMVDGSFSEEGAAEKSKPDCSFCKDNPRRKCKHCACSVCGGKDSPDKQILCDDCDMAYHLWCLTPKLDAVPDCEDW